MKVGWGGVGREGTRLGRGEGGQLTPLPPPLIFPLVIFV